MPTSPQIDPALLDPKLDAAAQSLVESAQQADQAGRMATSEPLPGASRKAFSVVPDVVVGPYRVRQARDYDLKLLRQLENPFYQLAMTGDETGVTVTGEHAWDFCWIMTRPVREVKAFVEQNGLKELRRASEEFGFLATGDLAMIVNAAARQLAASSTTAVDHQVALLTDNGPTEAAKRDHPPSGAPLTA